jgi:hypothetical protein
MLADALWFSNKNGAVDAAPLSILWECLSWE